jgi:pyruvate dehydrogenase (quinone)
MGLIGDCRSVLEELVQRIPENHDEDHLESVHAAKEDWNRLMRRLADPGRSEGVIHPQAVAAALSEASRDGAVFTCDTGAVTVWGARHLDLRKGQRLLYSFNLATMAFAMPGAIGIQLLHPDRQVIALCGDGGFNMLMGDFLTAVKYALPIKAVIFNNGRLGLIQMEQEVEGYPEHETKLLNPDYALLARAFGAVGRSVSNPAELRDAVHATLAEDGPAILDVRIKTDELAMPPRIEAKQAWGFARARIKEWFSGHQRGS